MKAHVLMSWACYWAGDAVSRIDQRFPDWSRVTLYPVYHRLMNWAVTLQGDSERGPWRNVP